MTEKTESTKGLFALIGELPALVIRTVRGEIELVKAELRQRAAAATGGLIAFVVGGVLALIGLILLIVAGVAGLALIMPFWLAALIVGGSFLLIAGLFLLVGLGAVQKVKAPLRFGPSGDAAERARHKLAREEAVRAAAARAREKAAKEER